MPSYERALSPEQAECIAALHESIGHCLQAFYHPEPDDPTPERIVELLRELDRLLNEADERGEPPH